MVLAQRPSGDLLLKYPYNNVVGHFYEPGNRTTIQQRCVALLYVIFLIQPGGNVGITSVTVYKRLCGSSVTTGELLLIQSNYY